jgi:uncharacterized iron-regulated protein
MLASLPVAPAMPVSTNAEKRLALLALLFSFTTICCAASGPVRWRSELGRTHPLTGQIWDIATRALVTEDELADRLGDARFVLLGEQHLNPDHHALQGRLIRALVRRERRPAVVMEMLDTGDSDAIHECLDSGRCSPRALTKAVAWDASGWPDWRLYEPVLSAALANDLPPAPASLPPETVRAFAKTGELPIPESEIRRLGLDRPLDASVREAMAGDIRASHCGYAPEEMLDGMVAAQRLRDAHMAESMMMAGPLGRAVLIAGTEHVRTDRGVRARLRAEAPDDLALSVGFLEVDDELIQPAAYTQHFRATDLPLDFVWFTPRLDDEDPCEKFREQLEKIGSPPAVP